MAVNCGALPDSLAESELFGYRKGAFTDASRDKPGRFALAEGGTLFLDEIGEISPAMQVKLLRVLQEREYTPLGAVRSEKADVRILAATNKDLAAEVGHGRFRQDLFFRLNVIRVSLPPLRARTEDIPLLVDHFIKKFNATQGRRITGVSERAMAALMQLRLPGQRARARERHRARLRGLRGERHRARGPAAPRPRGAPDAGCAGRGVAAPTTIRSAPSRAPRPSPSARPSTATGATARRRPPGPGRLPQHPLAQDEALRDRVAPSHSGGAVRALRRSQSKGSSE